MNTPTAELCYRKAGTDTVSHYIAGTVTESGSQNWCRQCGQQIAEDDEDGRTDDKLFRDDGGAGRRPHIGPKPWPERRRTPREGM